MFTGLLSVFIHPWFSIYFFGILPLTILCLLPIFRSAQVTSFTQIGRIFNYKVNKRERTFLIIIIAVHAIWFALPWAYTFHPIGEEYLVPDLVILNFTLAATLGFGILVRVEDRDSRRAKKR